MTYRTKTHNTLAALTSLARRAHKWVMVQPLSKVLDVRTESYIHHGSAY